MKKIICPLCSASMEYKQISDTHVWSCEDCPAILFEYYSDTNTAELSDFLKK